MIGGVTVDKLGRTTIDGLWAAGEVSSSGLHGANRLASNSLLEGLVYGFHTGHEASRRALEIPDNYQALPLSNDRLPEPDEALDLTDIRNSLKSLIWRDVGIRRDRAGLLEAQEMTDRWCQYVFRRQFNEPAGWQLQNMLTVSRVMIAAALEREESRGVHLRSDFPQIDPRWDRHLSFTREQSA